MELEEFTQKLEQLKRDLIAEAPAIAYQMASDGKAYAYLRITSEGVGSYSTNPIPTFFFKGRELNKAGEDWLEKHSMGTWSEFKDAQGVGSEFVNLLYSGRTFAGIVVIGESREGEAYVAEIGGSDKEVQEVMDNNYLRYGNYLMATPEEERKIAEGANDRIAEIISRQLDLD